jgi:hypothetical protein
MRLLANRLNETVRETDKKISNLRNICCNATLGVAVQYIRGFVMQQKAVSDVRRRMHAIPWDTPIRVQFYCDEAPLFGCRLCILRFGLRTGDRSYLFDSEDEAILHTCSHADVKAS